MSALLDFLFGKDPKIFDEKGQVRHKFPEKKWLEWQNRFKNPDYNWREHSAKKAKAQSQAKN